MEGILINSTQTTPYALNDDQSCSREIFNKNTSECFDVQNNAMDFEIIKDKDWVSFPKTEHINRDLLRKYWYLLLYSWNASLIITSRTQQLIGCKWRIERFYVTYNQSTAGSSEYIAVVHIMNTFIVTTSYNLTGTLPSPSSLEK